MRNGIVHFLPGRKRSKTSQTRLKIRALQVCNRAKKLNVFGRPGGGWNPSPTKLGMVIEDLEHVLAPLKLLGV